MGVPDSGKFTGLRSTCLSRLSTFLARQLREMHLLVLLGPSTSCTEWKLGTDTRPDNLPRHIPTLPHSAGIHGCESGDWPLKPWSSSQVNRPAPLSQTVRLRARTRMPVRVAKVRVAQP